MRLNVNPALLTEQNEAHCRGKCTECKAKARSAGFCCEISEYVFATFVSPFTGLQQGAVGVGGGGCRHHVDNNPSSLFQQ